MKAGHQHPVGFLQPLLILEWKWEVISLDWITGFPKPQRHHDSIIVVVKKLSKVDHFIPANSTCKASGIMNLFMKEVFRLHGLSKAIVQIRIQSSLPNFGKGYFKSWENN